MLSVDILHRVYCILYIYLYMFISISVYIVIPAVETIRGGRETETEKQGQAPQGFERRGMVRSHRAWNLALKVPGSCDGREDTAAWPKQALAFLGQSTACNSFILWSPSGDRRMALGTAATSLN